MGKGHRRCEVCGIKEAWHTANKLLFSKFPLDPNRCREWLKAVGNEELVHLPIEKLHEQRNVCANHFEKKDFNKKGNRLKRHAIPTLNLMASPLTDGQLAEFPQYVYRHSESKDLLPEAVPSTSQQSRHVLKELSQNDLLPEAVPSTSQQLRHVLKDLSQNEIMRTQSQKRSGKILENKATFEKRSQAKPNLTPREKQLMQQLAKTKCSLSSLRRKANVLEKLESDFHNEVFQDPENKEELSGKSTCKQVGLGESVAASSSQDIPVLSIPEEFEPMEIDLTEMEQQPIVYVSGYIASIILKTNKCDICEKCLKIEDPDDDHV